MAYAIHYFPIEYYASVWKLQVLYQQMSSVADQEGKVLFLFGHWPLSRGPNHAGRIGPSKRVNDGLAAWSQGQLHSWYWLC